MKYKYRIKWIVAAFAVAIIFMLNIGTGRYPVSPSEVLLSMLQRLTGTDFGITAEAVTIVMDNRLPRTFAGALVGAALAASGCAFQGLFNNPLVSQGILGVSSGAGFGAALAILIFSSTAFSPLFAFIFALAAVFLSFMAAKICGQVTTLMLVLGGTIISSVFSSLLSFLKYVADPYNQLASIVFWNMGSLASIESSVLPYSSAAMLVGIIILLCCRWQLNVMSMGEQEAQSMGLSVSKYRFLIVCGATLATAGSVSIAGAIGWVGLIVPHMSRFIVGSDNRRLIPFSILLGAGFMMFIDLLCRTISGAEIPLGILTSLIGGPFFIYLLRRYKGGGWQ